ncbi:MULTISPECIES: DNA polymerase III subunit gamma/tau [Campylobacter]|uniref:DNA polymerase III subunit gamma/tau n=1 Tax=Campylobacter TaxID=194 RepID=UPI000A33A22C|nr:DNA polymerase III subunit gamma/tau [Campylobacter sp. P0024]MCR8679508.1 DNA polymerase III subunit gamma/tau [Campylobacter sp. RM19072]
MKALALKYRPKSFDELIGQDVVANTLSHALDSNRLGHAYLFSGLRGSGKTSSARIFAKALLCQKGISAHPCEVCPNCIMANENRHMDIIEMDAASHRKIDDIRELIEQTKYSPSSARFKIFIIDEVHMLTKEAFNALLKTLEEPPDYVKFILATTDPLKLPATVLSRTQHFRFHSIAKASVVKHLEFILNKEGIEFEERALEVLARSGGGSLRDTLTLLDQAIIYSHEKLTHKVIVDMLGLLDPDKIDEIFAVVNSRDKNELLKLLNELQNYDSSSIIDELIENLKYKFIHQNSQYSLLIFERFFRILSEAKSMLSNLADPEFVLFITLFMMVEAFNLRSIDDAITELKNKPITPNLEPQNRSTPIQPKSDYQNFVDFLYDKSYDLGILFDECVSLKGLENGVLTLEFAMSNEQLDLARKHYNDVILPAVKASYGDSIKLNVQKVAPKEIGALSRAPMPPITQQINKPKTQNSGPKAINEPSGVLSLKSSLSQEEINLKELKRLFGEPEIISNS